MSYQNLKSIAILLAVYNGEQYLGEQIDSLLNQTNQDWTLYIRNDGSTDNTQGVIDAYMIAHPDRVFQIDRNGENLGCRGNFFRLLEVVESDYYMFCDADDVWLSEKVQISYQTLKGKETISSDRPLLVHTDKIVCDENLKIVVPSWWRAVRLNPDLFLKLRHIPISPVVGGATTLFNRAVREQCLPIPENPPQHDCWIPFQTAKYGKIFSIHIPLILYRQHTTNTVGAQTDPYQFKVSKLGKVKSIYKRDMEIAQYFKRLGYGSVLKYFFSRLEVLVKLQWSKITYK